MNQIVGVSIALWAAATVHAQEIAPNANLRAEGIPPIPAALARQAALYTEFRPRSVVSWHPVRHELLVATRATNTTQLHHVRRPLGELTQATDYAEPVRSGLWLPAKPDVLVFARDTGGNEQGQIYRLEPGMAQPALLTDSTRRHQLHSLNRARDRVLIASTDVDQAAGRREQPTLDISLLDPLAPERTRKIATLPGTGWGDFSFSFDDRRLAAVEFRSVTDASVWLIDVASGTRQRVLPADGQLKVGIAQLNFSRDGRGLYLATDRDGEFRRAAYLDLQAGSLAAFGPAGADVEELGLSRDGRTLALVTNEGGLGVLRLYDADTRQELARPQLPIGTVHGVQWHPDSGALAFNLNSAQSPGDVYVLDLAARQVTRWTEAKVEGLEAAAFRAP